MGFWKRILRAHGLKQRTQEHRGPCLSGERLITLRSRPLHAQATNDIGTAGPNQKQKGQYPGEHQTTFEFAGGFAISSAPHVGMQTVNYNNNNNNNHNTLNNTNHSNNYSTNNNNKMGPL